MPSHPTVREAFAGVLVHMVLARCAEAKANQASREGLLESVPSNERAYVRRGIAALVDHGALSENGDELALTREAKALLAYLEWAETSHPGEEPPDPHAPAAPLRGLIGNDARLVPPKAIENIRSLPARLEAYRETQRSVLSRWAVVLMLGAVAAAAYALLQV
jgi:hypothetical protein